MNVSLHGDRDLVVVSTQEFHGRRRRHRGFPGIAEDLVLSDVVREGLFRQRSSADGLQKKVSQLGFGEVAIREVGSTSTEFWVEVREISKLDETTRRRVKAEDKDVQWQMISCRHQPADV